MSVRAERRLLGWRTRSGRATAARHLDLLAVAVAAKGYRHIKLYQAEEFPVRPLVLWIFALGPDEHVRVAVTVRAMPGRGWAYYEAGRRRHGFLSRCGDTGRAAAQVDAMLKHRMFSATW
ncbi:hypothetical protein ACFQY7_42480 [Actinomadura luteofluorescens]|uniref:Uncharacterized protein n=1 Tax=Actinomadura luteofluorescens TaxID=46163 RepID=A0A7Y9EII5_9ACTN|nr:hypothetical protein [Actinomadura luteofluorescens]NYD47825.1 hypothetical protein [Actinomadura luteofluorescens]